MSERIVVVGDAMLDRDLDGRAERLSPDAPVPVVHQPVTRTRPGGAALAASLLAADGMAVTLVTALGADEAGREVAALLAARGIEVIDLRREGATPEKVRIRADGHPVARVDYDDDVPRFVAAEMVTGALAETVCGVLVSDYGRGVASHPAVRAALAQVVTRVPLVWDPHPRGEAPVPSARLVTPNRAEASIAGERTESLPATARAATCLAQRWEASGVAITLAADGAVLGMPGRAPFAVPAPFRAVGDPCGAGDRFASCAAAALARGSHLPEAVRDAVGVASAFVRGGGVVAMTSAAASESHHENDRSSVHARGGTVVATSGCFDLLHAGHVASLRAARALGDYLVVLLNSDDSVRRLKGPGRPLVPERDRATVLQSLSCVDAVEIFDEDTPVEALRRVRPSVFVKGGDYGVREIPEQAALEEWGGAVVIVPYLEGRSTSRLVEGVRGGR